MEIGCHLAEIHTSKIHVQERAKL